MKNIFNKFLYSSILVVILFNFCCGLCCKAADIENANIFYVDRADYHLKYYREDTDSYRYLICSIVGYSGDNGILSRSTQTKEANAEAQAREQSNLAYMTVRTEIAALKVKDGTYIPASSEVKTGESSTEKSTQYLAEGDTPYMAQITINPPSFDTDYIICHAMIEFGLCL